MVPIVSVVDDDRSVRESLGSLIRSAGMAVHVFASAEEFLNSSYLSKTACLVLDLRMPGMSGTELHHHLLSKGHRVPVIFMTAHDSDERARTQALLRGATAYLIKPFDENEFLDAVHRALKSKQTG